jgi:hypothetical protein
MTAKSALDYANFAGRALSEVDRPDAYNTAVRETIKFRATQKKQAAWLAADETRADLIEVIGVLAYDKGGFWASMKEAYDNWGGLTAGQEAAVRRSLDQDAARKAERKAADANSVHVGTVGERRDWTLTLQGTFEYDTDFGTTFGHIYKDADGNVVIYKGSKSLDGERGDTVTLKATVKAHTDRDGVAQTLLSRPKAV